MWYGMSEEERATRLKLTSDTCIFDDESYLIRGVLEIPLTDEPEVFGFGVWVSQKKENFEKYLANFESAEIGPFFGWLCTSIRYYEGGTLHLKTMAHFQGGTLRPKIVVEPTDHPLAVDQREGISHGRSCTSTACRLSRYRLNKKREQPLGTPCAHGLRRGQPQGMALVGRLLPPTCRARSASPEPKARATRELQAWQA
jgi:hypothetical protein